jgi:tetratricopeptide (TPR) repeat protein
LLATFVLAFSLAAGANGDSNEKLFDEAVAALDRGALDDSIDRLELLADRGFSHPDASYDRAIAYVRRAQSRGAKRGDLGRAAAALAEVLEQRPDDAEASAALGRVRREIAKRRARSGASEVDLKPSLGWAMVGLLEEDTWAMLAMIGSAVASLGLALWLASKKEAMRLAGTIAASLGAVTLVLTGALAAFARYERVHYRPAVVVVEEARLLDDNGATVSGPGSVIPEGASVRVTDQRGTLAHVEWGTLDGWLSLGQLRLLARP